MLLTFVKWTLATGYGTYASLAGYLCVEHSNAGCKEAFVRL